VCQSQPWDCGPWDVSFFAFGLVSEGVSRAWFVIFCLWPQALGRQKTNTLRPRDEMDSGQGRDVRRRVPVHFPTKSLGSWKPLTYSRNSGFRPAREYVPRMASQRTLRWRSLTSKRIWLAIISPTSRSRLRLLVANAPSHVHPSVSPRTDNQSSPMGRNGRAER
jgi:hypothetical protein